VPKITFIEFNGTEHAVEAAVGKSVMQTAADNLVPGIVADCGGNCACATCHVYIEEPWASRTEPPSNQEKEMIDCALHVRETSRLSCQVPVTPALDGLVVRLPESQM
jgi:2Fe-2S ferredoxin